MSSLDQKTKLNNATHIECILFDLDGTLVDTAADFINVLNAQLVDHGHRAICEQSIRDTVSNGARALTSLAFGGKEGEAEFEDKREELLDRYANCAGDQAQLFDGMNTVLSSLESAGIPWGIITNKPRYFTDILLKKLSLDTRSSVTLCPDDVSKPKPDPESMYIAAKKLNCQLKNSVYVGDHLRDIEAGKRANMITVAATYGYIQHKSEVATWGADFDIVHPSELISLFHIK